ncbi:lojap-related protein [Wolffia australiana]
MSTMAAIMAFRQPSPSPCPSRRPFHGGSRTQKPGALAIPPMAALQQRLRPLQSQRGAGNNVNEDTDEALEELLEEYGEIVYRRGDATPIAEVDDDAESLSFAIALAMVANDVKAGDIRVLFVKPLVYWTRFFIIVTAFSRPQIDAIGSRIRDLAEEKFKRVPSGDSKPNSWTLLDFGDVVVHIFLPQQRAFYNLEEFYGNATLIDVPFDQPPPFRR